MSGRQIEWLFVIGLEIFENCLALYIAGTCFLLTIQNVTNEADMASYSSSPRFLVYEENTNNVRYTIKKTLKTISGTDG